MLNILISLKEHYSMQYNLKDTKNYLRIYYRKLPEMNINALWD
jgi:hypothetical protein